MEIVRIRLNRLLLSVDNKGNHLEHFYSTILPLSFENEIRANMTCRMLILTSEMDLVSQNTTSYVVIEH